LDRRGKQRATPLCAGTKVLRKRRRLPHARDLPAHSKNRRNCLRFMGREHLPALDVSWGHEPGGARAARVPAALERRKEASETLEGCREMCEPHVPRLNGTEPATQRRPHHFTPRLMESPLFRTDLLTAHEPLSNPRSFSTTCGYGSWEGCTTIRPRVGTMNASYRDRRRSQCGSWRAAGACHGRLMETTEAE